MKLRNPVTHAKNPDAISACDACDADDVQFPPILVSQGPKAAPIPISDFTFCLDGLTRCDACYAVYKAPGLAHSHNDRRARSTVGASA